ncbi:L-proline trans-4-hydroxylase-like [Ylistrum balloti]|uniref:L-proline trans-4-hydroxylase-like n=1 Tax=Ylistrum balloti TaxID=509963 RepID=UPI002905F507|nr:L-proline trans-4-hydroxylase-like [Ylistrum balloti]
MDKSCDFRLGDDGSFEVTESVLRAFWDKGYIIIRALLDNEELTKVKEVIENPNVLKYQYGRPDKSGKEPKLILWQHPGDDVTGMVARCRKIAGTCDKLLGGEVYHYHTKLVTKEPYIGGTFEWHQDYGYWYKYGCLFPDMMSVFVAVDQCRKANGCLQLLSGSHKCGRIDHTIVAHQTGADVDRVEAIQEKLQHVYAELDAGDALFFHCNVLHTSTDNTSADNRRGLILAYNRKSNNPGPHQKHPGYRPINQVSDDAVRQCTNTTNFEGKDFWIVQPQI